jgi:hypothetical protein
MVLVGAGLALFSDGSGNSAQAAVIGAVNSTMADKTAHLTLSVTTSTASGSVNVTGTGDVDFSQNALQMNASLDADGQQQNVAVVYVGGTIYEQIPAVSQLFPGKTWVSIDVSGLTTGSGAGGDLGSNPLAMLHLLAQQGNTVTPIGSSTVDGVPVQGYKVTITSASISAELDNPNLPTWMRQATSMVKPGNATETVYVDGAGNLRQVDADVTERVSTVSLTVHVAENFSDLGESVTVSTPPANEVITFQQFLQARENSPGSAAVA